MDTPKLEDLDWTSLVRLLRLRIEGKGFGEASYLAIVEEMEKRLGIL